MIITTSAIALFLLTFLTLTFMDMLGTHYERKYTPNLLNLAGLLCALLGTVVAYVATVVLILSTISHLFT